MKKAQTLKPLHILILYTLLYLGLGALAVRFTWPWYWLLLPGVAIIFAAQALPLWNALALETIWIGAALLTAWLLPSEFDPALRAAEVLAVVVTPLILLTHYLSAGKKTAAQEVLQDLERSQLAFEGTRDGIWDWKPEIPELYFSPNLHMLLGMDKITSLSRPALTESIHPDDRETVLQKFTEHYANQSPRVKTELRIKNAQGEWSWVLLQGKVIERNANNQPLRVTGTVTDIAEQKKMEQELKESEMRFRQVTENMREGYWLRDRATRQLLYMKVTDCILSIEDIAEEVRFIDPGYFYEDIHPDDRERVRTGEDELYRDGKRFLQDYRFRHKDGTYHWLRCGQYPVQDEQGNFYRVVGVVEDINEQKQAALALEKSEKRFRDMVEHQGEAVIIVDENEVFLYTNPAAGDLFGVPSQSLLGHRWHEFLDPKQLDLLLAQTMQRRRGLESSYEMVINRPIGGKRNILCTVTPRLSETNRYAGGIGVIRDITEHTHEVEQLRYQSTHDSLTGLHNRAYFEKELYRLETSDFYPIAIIMIDMDGLKKINDCAGHAAGDIQLVRTADLLRTSFREDDIVARIGGDEFAILMPFTNQPTLEAIIRRLREKISRKNHLPPWSERPIEISIGGEVRAAPGSLKDTLNQADARMYVDKFRKREGGTGPLPRLL